MSFLDWIYPPRCMACRTLFAPVHNEEPKYICHNCEPLLVKVPDPRCTFCGYPTTAFSDSCITCKDENFLFKSHRALFIYDGVLRELILDIKFRSRRRTAIGLGLIFAKAVQDWDFIKCDYLVPVPLHFSKKRSRGFNQAEVLAQPLAEALDIPLACNMLKRVKKTAPQMGLSGPAREQNLFGAFIINPKRYEAGRRILLVDDIFTSGATMNACAKILLENGAKEVHCLSLSFAVEEKLKEFLINTNTNEDF